jgi:hypothetical protein
LIPTPAAPAKPAASARLEERPWLLAFCQTPYGKAAILLAATWLFSLDGGQWPEKCLGLALILAVPRWRRWIVSLLGLYLLTSRLPPGWGALQRWASERHLPFAGDAPRVASLVLAGAACVGYAALYARSPRLLKQPVAILLALVTAALFFASALPPAPALYLWAFLFALSPLVWYLSYTLVEVRQRGRSPLWMQLGQYTPLWGTTNVPWPRGDAALNKLEIRDDDRRELARWQVKGLKLLVWATLLSRGEALFRRLVHGTGWLADQAWLPALKCPTLAAALESLHQGHPVLLKWRWLALAANFIEALFSIAVQGNVIIAGCRLAGFKALRNTHRPLEATSIADFYNRLFYYFKELLAAVFFYPTYLRCFKARPRLRLFFATLMAAGFGNLAYHWLRDMDQMLSLGVWRAAAAFQTYAVYCLILGVAVGLSQLRKKQAHRGLRSFARRGFVLFFYMCILIFDDPRRDLTVWTYFRYLASLVNV